MSFSLSNTLSHDFAFNWVHADASYVAVGSSGVHCAAVTARELHAKQLQVLQCVELTWTNPSVSVDKLPASVALTRMLDSSLCP